MHENVILLALLSGVHLDTGSRKHIGRMVARNSWMLGVVEFSFAEGPAVEQRHNP